jgi:hypothetical protein
MGESRHVFQPHPKHPWWCADCGYPANEKLKHKQPGEADEEFKSEVEKLFEYRDEELGVVRLERWPEGYVLWVGGMIRWKSWEMKREPWEMTR